MAAARPALFPEPPRRQPAFSRGLAAAAWRLGTGETAKWTRLAATTRVDCMECALLQHEQSGSYFPRRKAKSRRTTPDGARLDLCHAHTTAWKTRDETDSAPPKGAA